MDDLTASGFTPEGFPALVDPSRIQALVAELRAPPLELTPLVAPAELNRYGADFYDYSPLLVPLLKDKGPSWR